MAYTGRSCWFCGRNGTADPLDKHHIFGGAYRKKSERYGLCVDLCHHDCHLFGEEAAHRNSETMQRLREYGQRKAMRENGWTVEDFRREFGKSYIDAPAGGTPHPYSGGAANGCAEAEAKEDREIITGAFCVLWDAALLPF